MAFEPINYANISPLGIPYLRDLLGTLTRGYETGQLPAQMARQTEKENLTNAMQRLLVEEQPQKFGEESQGRQLENALNKLKVQEEPKRFGSEQATQAMSRAFDQAKINQIKEELKLPFAGKIPPGNVGQALYVNMIKGKYGENSPEYQMAKKSYEADLSHTEATSDRQRQLINSGMFRSLPAAEKERVLAYAAGMGYTPDEAGKDLSNGNTLQDLADRKGVNLADVKPNYALTTPVITQSQTRNAFVSEIETLQKDLSPALAKVSRKVGGYSPKLLWGQISGKMSPDEQGLILAANALQPELAGLRARTLGAQNVGIELVREMEQKALAHLNTVESLVSPEAYQAMNNYINYYIGRANDAFSKSLQNQSRLGVKTEQPTKKRVFNLETGKYIE